MPYKPDKIDMSPTYDRTPVLLTGAFTECLTNGGNIFNRVMNRYIKC
jgi:hypothetical protein